MGALHRGGLGLVAVTLVALGGCTGPTERPVDVSSQSVEEERHEEAEGPGNTGSIGAVGGPSEEVQPSDGTFNESPPEGSVYGDGAGEQGYPNGGYGPPNGGYGYGAPPPGGVEIGGGPGYPGYDVRGCDAFGNCYRESEWISEGPGGYSYSRSSGYSVRSGSTCGPFGCVFY